MKRVTLICLIAIIALLSFGCGNGDEKKEVSQKDLVMHYSSLNSRYFEVIDFYDALGEKTISKFNWRIISDSSKKSSQRTIDALKNSDSPIAPKLIAIAEDVIAFTEELDGAVDKGKTPDMSYKPKIKAALEELEPEMTKMKNEILKQ